MRWISFTGETAMAYRWTMEDVLKVQRTQTRLPADAPPREVNARLKSVIGKPPKYRNRKVTDAEGNVHDSSKEFRHWQTLELRERAGEIRSLRRQVPYALVVDGALIARYVADFVYEEGAATVVVDCKSPPTRKLEAYRLKLKLMQAIHKIQIREV